MIDSEGQVARDWGTGVEAPVRTGSGLYIQSDTIAPWSFRGSSGTMRISFTSGGISSPRKKCKRSLQVITKSGEPARSDTLPWARLSTAAWLSWYFAACQEVSSG
jgi:hypothetical protein